MSKIHESRGKAGHAAAHRSTAMGKWQARSGAVDSPARDKNGDFMLGATADRPQACHAGTESGQKR